MSEQCNHDCSNCSENCAERDPKSFLKAPHKNSNIKKVIAVVSGKGGVGKSLVTGLSSVISNRCEYNTAILDADITGPSIPKMFGIEGQLAANDEGMFPAVSATGIKMVSTNLILENPTDPVIWRGPVIGGVVEQFWTDVMWGDVDYMFVDMPPGTGDVPLTVFQSLPVDGIIIVTSPQDLVSMIVEKAVNMAEMMNIPVLGIVENMSYLECPDCGKKINVFGESNIDELAKEKGIEVLGKIPVTPKLAELCDVGEIERFEGNWLEKIAANLIEMLPQD